jgi:MGT family glycosyltransferase
MQTNHVIRYFPASARNGNRILFANAPADGHFNPLTGLALHLKSIGYEIGWYSSAIYAEKIKKLGITYFPYVKALDANTDNIDQVFPERKKYKSQLRKLIFDMMNFFIPRSVEYYEDMKDIQESFPFDLVIADVAFTGVPFVKDKLNVPVITIGVLPLVETSRDLPPAGLGMEPSSSFFGRRRQDFLRFIADKVLFRKPYRAIKKIFAEHGMQTEGSNIFDIAVHKSTVFLQSGTPSFEYKRSDMGPNIRFIGPLLPHRALSHREPWFNEKLYKYDRVILVTQGTLEKDVNKIIVPTLEAYKGSSHLVVATTGGSQTQELRKKYPHDNIIIEDFIPFADIMPLVDVYVTNGGYGGVMLAIENRLPMVVAGMHEGKNEINARVNYFKLGINLHTELPTPDQIKNGVEKVLSDGSYAKNVNKLSDEFENFKPNELCAATVAELLKSKQSTHLIAKRELSSVN